MPQLQYRRIIFTSDTLFNMHMKDLERIVLRHLAILGVFPQPSWRIKEETRRQPSLLPLEPLPRQLREARRHVVERIELEGDALLALDRRFWVAREGAPQEVLHPPLVAGVVEEGVVGLAQRVVRGGCGGGGLGGRAHGGGGGVVGAAPPRRPGWALAVAGGAGLVVVEHGFCAGEGRRWDAAFLRRRRHGAGVVVLGGAGYYDPRGAFTASFIELRRCKIVRAWPAHRSDFKRPVERLRCIAPSLFWNGS